MRSMESAGFEYSFKVRLHDTDAAGVLFFAHLFRYAHDAYEAFMATAGFPLAGLITGAGPHLPLVHAEADYVAPIRHGEEIMIRLSLDALGDTSFTLTCGFLGPDGKEKARSRTIHVALNPQTGRPTPLPVELSGVLKELSPA